MIGGVVLWRREETRWRRLKSGRIVPFARERTCMLLRRKTFFEVCGVVVVVVVAGVDVVLIGCCEECDLIAEL
jgi:hypothetical protein